jgi:hypothetical protein
MAEPTNILTSKVGIASKSVTASSSGDLDTSSLIKNEFPPAQVALLQNHLTISYIPLKSEHTCLGLYFNWGSYIETKARQGGLYLLLQTLLHGIAPMVEIELRKQDPSFPKYSLRGEIGRSYCTFQVSISETVEATVALKAGLKVLQQLAQCSSITNAILTKVRQNFFDASTLRYQLHDLERSIGTPQFFNSNPYTTLWGDRSLGLPPEGYDLFRNTPDEIHEHFMAIPLERLQQLQNQYFSPDMAILQMTTTSILTLDQVQDLVEETFQTWCARNQDLLPILPPILHKGVAIKMQMNAVDVLQSEILWIFQSSAAEGRELLLLQVLAGHLQSQLAEIFSQVGNRENGKVEDVYPVRVEVIPYGEGSVLIIQAHTDPTEKASSSATQDLMDKITLKIRRFKDQLKQAVDSKINYPVKENFLNERRLLKGTVALNTQTPEEYVHYYAMELLKLGTNNPYEHLVEGLRQLDFGSYRDECVRLLSGKNLMVAYTPFHGANINLGFPKLD